MHDVRKWTALGFLLMLPLAPLPAMAAPVGVNANVDVDVAKTIDTLANWISRYVVHSHIVTDENIKKSLPALASKLAVLAGKNASFADSLSQPIQGNNDIAVLNAQLKGLRESIQEIVDLLNQADQQFGAAHTHLMTELSTTIDAKAVLLQRTDRIDLLQEDRRKALAEVMRVQAQKLEKAATDLSVALATR